MRFRKELLLFICLLLVCITHAQIITTVVGNGIEGYNGDGIPGTSAYLKGPSGVFVAEGSKIFFTDIYNDRLRYINTAGFIYTLAGTGEAGYNGDNIAASLAELNRPSGICIDSTGDIYIADWMNNRVRKIDHVTGKIITIAGAGPAGYNGDGIPAVNAKLNAPDDIAVDKNGNVFIADHNNDRIRMIDKETGLISTIAGTGMSAYCGDGGPASLACLNQPTGICFDPDGCLIIVDHGNAVIRRIDSLNIITTIAGNTIEAFAGDGMPALEASFDHPTSACYDGAGNLYIADQGNNRIRKIDNATNIITTFAGNGSEGFSGDGGDPVDAMLFAPWDICFDYSGNLYITDLMNNRVRKVVPPNEHPHIPQEEVIKDPVLSIYIPDVNSLAVYPNPASDHLNIPAIGSTYNQSILTVMDINGKEIFHQQIDPAQDIIISTNDFSKGIYILNIQAAATNYTASFMVQ